MDLRQFIPDLTSCASVLCIQPHPDDNEVGAGATIAKLARAGCDITYLTVTDGGMGTMDPAVSRDSLTCTRRAETKAAAQYLGVNHLLFLDYPDGGPYDEQELCQRIVSAIREVRPEFVMAPDPFLPYEAHPDHRKTGMAAAEACLFCQFPHYYNYGEDVPAQNTWKVKGIAFYNTAYPNTYIGVDETLEQKIQALGMHKSQFPESELAFMRQYLTLKAAENGGKSGRYTYAEAFKVLPPLLLHVNVDIDA
jgi:LmbE family N-acetylglucosaminyl deacetylase